MKNKLIIILLFCNICCFGQQKDRIDFYKEMPHFSKSGMIWKRDTISYYKVNSKISLYKSSFKEYPYMYKYIDKKKEEYYFFIREKDIKITKNKIEIEIYDESELKLSILERVDGLLFSFNLN